MSRSNCPSANSYLVYLCSRDRNREHAKNTRLRKKAYILKLKELVDRMAQQKEKEERERRALGVRIHDTVSSRIHSV
jgi:signal transduction histidine kinase